MRVADGVGGRERNAVCGLRSGSRKVGEVTKLATRGPHVRCGTLSGERFFPVIERIRACVLGPGGDDGAVHRLET